MGDCNLIARLKAGGAPTNIRVTGYWKYTFDIDFEVDGERVWLRCGGNDEYIYKFDPFGGWEEWDYAGITSIGLYFVPANATTTTTTTTQ